MLLAHKIRLNPTPEQATSFRKAAGTARFAYNWGLAEIKRGDALHKLTTHLARKAAFIGVEDLNVVGMLKNRRLAQAISDASPSELSRQLRYKAAWHGGVVQAVGRFFPSSKLHHGCGGYKADLELSERMWICPACGASVDRDLNAARNIRDEALRLSASPVVATSGCQSPVDAM